MTYYKVLGVDPTSSMEAIRMAYFNRLLTLQKLQKDPILFEQQFIQIRRAFEFLTDPIKRKKYDSDFERGLPGTAPEESADTYNLYLRAYYFTWEDFATLPQEFKSKKITAEIIVWLVLFGFGGLVAMALFLGGEFDYTSFGDVLTVVIFGGLLASLKEIISAFRRLIIKAKK
jgi:curved DNA-binding protein CbpA